MRSNDLKALLIIYLVLFVPVAIIDNSPTPIMWGAVIFFLVMTVFNEDFMNDDN